jgi:hypothetical protein
MTQVRHGGSTLTPISNKNTKIPPITGQFPASEVKVALQTSDERQIATFIT